MKILIVEDELLLAKRLTQQLASIVPDAEILAHTRSISETVQWLNTCEMPDLIFMDIELPDGQCFEIFRRHPTFAPVIFTTAHFEFALQAFNHNSIDYLLKPIQDEDLKLSIEKWTTQKNLFAATRIQQIDALLQHLELSWGPVYRERFLVKRGSKMLSVPVKDIMYFCSRQSLSYLITQNNKEYCIDTSLDVIEKMLNPFHFKRINRQYLISHSFIQSVESISHGKLLLTGAFPVGEALIVSREKATEIKQWLGA